VAAEQPVPQQPYGEVFDRGYQHYAGERLGRSNAVRALIIYSIKRGLGIKKKWTAKILPIILYAIAFLPALIIVALLAFLPADELGIGFDSLYGTIETVILIFAAALAPEMLADDRRDNVLSLYFSRPITRWDYLGAKVGAMSILMGTIVFGPPLLLYFGLILNADSPVSYFFDNLDTLLRIAGYGVLLAAFFSALGLIIAQFTTRKGIAAAVLIVGTLLLTGIANAFFEALSDQSWRGFLLFVSPLEYIGATRVWIFGTGTSRIADASDIPGVLYIAYAIAIVAMAMYMMHRRYEMED
jgi:ABC-2 type transport system permease protein